MYDKAGISLPRVAQDQYDATQEISMEEAQAGDLIFFHSTYNAGTYVTHVAIYLEEIAFIMQATQSVMAT